MVDSTSCGDGVKRLRGETLKGQKVRELSSPGKVGKDSAGWKGRGLNHCQR